jgi:hypothetical protein
MRKIAARLRSTSSSVVAQQDTLMRMAARPCHSVPPHQQVPSLDGKACLAQTLGEARGQTAVPFDQAGEAAAP